MEAQQQHVNTSGTSREAARSQRVPGRAHVKGGSNDIAYQKRLAQIKKRLLGRLTETDASLNKQIAARINIATNRTGQQTRLTRCEMKTTSETTASSTGDSGKSSPTPDSDAERSASPATDRTSDHGSGNVRTARKFSEVLMVISGRYGELQGELRDAHQRLCEEDAQHQALDQKDTKQREQRLRDKELVDSWSQEVASMDTRCAEVDDANRVLKDRLAEATKKHQADLDAKDEEMSILKADYELAVAAMTNENKERHQACEQKDSAFQKKFSSALRESIKVTMHELRILQKVAQGQQGLLGNQDHRELLELVSRTTAKNKSLVEAKADMEEDFRKIEQWSKTITDKCESEVMKAKSGANYWFDLYFNEAIPTTERLHTEIAALKAEKGKQHFVEPTPPINPEVYDRKMLQERTWC